MKIIEIIRLEDSSQGTFGVLKIDKAVFCCTLEPPDFANAPRRSCIPAQQYICERYQSPTFGRTFRVRDVPGRSNILFHPGNKVEDTAGCILLGQYFGKLAAVPENRAILNSGATFSRFLNAVNEIEFHLTIKEAY